MEYVYVGVGGHLCELMIMANCKYCLLHLFSFVFCPFRGCNKIKSKGFPRRFHEVPSSGERGEKGSR